MSANEPLTPHERDNALLRLREWRTAIAAGSAGAVVAFGVVAAATIPGHAASSGNTPSSSTPAVPNSGDGTQPQPQDNGQVPSIENGDVSTLQQPQQLPGFGVRGGGQAVSGGSR